jgi:hypothetical protein
MNAVDAERRRARRLLVEVPTTVECLAAPPVPVSAALAAVYQRVEPDITQAGRAIAGVVRDLSTNGAFVAGEPLPLLSRVAFRFTVPQLGPVEALGWIMWRRTDDVTLDRPGGGVTLPRGFGVLFEAVPLDARLGIHRLLDGSRTD